VGIGGSQTGVYTVDSPGGWRIIGRTALRLFDPAATPPALLRIGDRVRFVPMPGTRS
jgi:allophanate hydrolase subunit 1